jgi:hypothetical protein
LRRGAHPTTWTSSTVHRIHCNQGHERPPRPLCKTLHVLYTSVHSLPTTRQSVPCTSSWMMRRRESRWSVRHTHPLKFCTSVPHLTGVSTRLNFHPRCVLIYGTYDVSSTDKGVCCYLRSVATTDYLVHRLIGLICGLCVAFKWTRGRCLETMSHGNLQKQHSFGNQGIGSHSDETKKGKVLGILTQF